MNKFKKFFISVLLVFSSFAAVFAQWDDSILLWQEENMQDYGQYVGSKQEKENVKVKIKQENKSGFVSGFHVGLALPLEYDEEVYTLAYSLSSMLEFGGLFHLGGRAGITLVAEIGYNLSAIGTSYEYEINPRIESDMIYVSSFAFGLVPKINIGVVSIGFGGGLKIPFAAISTSCTYYSDSFNIYGKNISDDIDLAPYLKAVFDYSFFVDTKTAIVLGIDATYNFAVGNKKLKASEEGYYIGGRIGLRFAPKL